VRIITSDISISLSEEIPVLDIVISCYQTYIEEKKDELNYELMRLASKGYKKGEKLVDMLMRGFVENYRKEFYKEKMSIKAYKTVKESVDAMLDSDGFELETSKVKVKIPYPSLKFISVIGSKLRGIKLHKSKPEEKVVIDGQELIQINEEMQKVFNIKMNSYFTYLIQNGLIQLVLNSEKETSAFHERYLTLFKQIDDASNLQFVKWLFPENDELWDKIYKDE
jgi:hypothetical protein